MHDGVRRWRAGDCDGGGELGLVFHDETRGGGCPHPLRRSEAPQSFRRAQLARLPRLRSGQASEGVRAYVTRGEAQVFVGA